MKYRHIGLGTKLELELFNEEGKKIPAVFVSQFGGFDEELNVMEIYAPIFQGNIYPVTPKTQMDVFFSKGKETFSFKAEALERFYEGNIVLLHIIPVSPIEKIERRTFFRMDCELSVQYRTFDILLPDEEMRGDFINARTRNISGGGICLVTKEKLEKGIFVEAYIRLKQKLRFVGVVIRTIEVKNRGRIEYESGIEYIRIENRVREKIISYVFRTQREILKKGWIKDGQQNSDTYPGFNSR
ncbi:MAG: flagellar brake protein [Clostridiaceae bacterium]|jgi:c-di-GMP-binding flagellar brake protein YcgR|nr:flagellar brake protein [Clostridiaceae bacterium]